MKKIFFTIAKVVTLCGIMALGLTSCSKENSNSKAPSKAPASSSGHFITIDSKTIFGERITNEFYKENDFTLVNIMATWCGPCVHELPELQQIHQENNGFGVVGVVLDTYDERTGKEIPSAIEEAKLIADATGVTYPLAIPTAEILENTINKAAALLPMSFVVNKEGKIVKGPIPGARNKNQWLSLLNGLK